MYHYHFKYPLTEEIRLETFGSADLPDFRVDLLNDGAWWRGLRLLEWKIVWNFEDSRENVFDMDGDWGENLLKILAVVIILSRSPPSVV